MMKQVLTVLLGMTISVNTSAQRGNIGIDTAVPGSKLTVNGSFAGAYTSVTANTYTAGKNDLSIMWNGTAAGTITLYKYLQSIIYMQGISKI